LLFRTRYSLGEVKSQGCDVGVSGGDCGRTVRFGTNKGRKQIKTGADWAHDKACRNRALGMGARLMPGAYLEAGIAYQTA
jgi:hypothetical protein